MYRDHSVGVVVPAYNEAGNVGQVIDTLPEYVDRAYVVDDASTDGTSEEIAGHAGQVNAQRTPDAPGFDDVVVPLAHDENRGVGGAIKTGYLHARAERIDVTAVLAGDGQMDPAELERYLDPIVEGTADYAKGNRFLRPEDHESMPRFRLAGSLVLSYLTKIASGYWRSMDPQNGYTAVSLTALDRIDIEDLYEEYGFSNDMLVQLNVENLRVAEVARSSTFAYDGDWTSNIDYTEFVPRGSALLLRNFVRRLNRKYLVRDFHPLALLYYLGMAVGGAALAGLAGSLLGLGRGGRPGRWLTALLGGALLFLAAAVLDRADNRDLEHHVVPGTESTGSGRRSEPTGEHEVRGRDDEDGPVGVQADGDGSVRARADGDDGSVGS